MGEEVVPFGRSIVGIRKFKKLGKPAFRLARMKAMLRVADAMHFAGVRRRRIPPESHVLLVVNVGDPLEEQS